jgi:hypothetical protein
MRRTSHLAAVIGLFLAANSHFSTARAQGSLVPPGPPGGTMKSLSDLDAKLEHRTPISSLPYSILSPGSYYITTNLTGTASQNGINIVSGNVTLDLNGFSLTGVPNSDVGVYVDGVITNVTVVNGIITHWGGNGLDGFTFSPVQNLLLEHLNCSANTGQGVIVQGSSVIKDCLSEGNGFSGFYVLGGLVSNCRASFNGDAGILAWNTKVTGCYFSGNFNSGITVYGPDCAIVGNECFQNNLSGNASYAGIFIDDSNNRIEDNHLVANGHAGIYLNTFYTNNIIIRNSVSGNTNTLVNNYITGGNNIIGPLISQFGTITNYNPWANFSY